MASQLNLYINVFFPLFVQRWPQLSWVRRKPLELEAQKETGLISSRHTGTIFQRQRQSLRIVSRPPVSNFKLSLSPPQTEEEAALSCEADGS